MPQIFLKGRTAHLDSYTFLQEMLIYIKTLLTLFFTKHLSLATFVPQTLQSF